MNNINVTFGNVTFGNIPDIQVLDAAAIDATAATAADAVESTAQIDAIIYQNANESEQRLLRMIDSMDAMAFGENNENNENNENVELCQGVSREFLSGLKECVVDEKLFNEKKECSICMESFKLGDKYIELPCSSFSSGQNHMFHSGMDGCSGIKPWLERNNTCPLCRTEFPKSEPSNNHILNILNQIILSNSRQIISNEESDIQRAIELSLTET